MSQQQAYIIDSVQQAFNEILSAAKNAPNNSELQYAASYARAGFGMSGHTLKVQILYVLNNLGTWRGPFAREVKTYLKTQTN